MRQGVTLPAALIPAKITDHQRKRAQFQDQLHDRIGSLKNDPSIRNDFLKEMRRFLPAAAVRETVAQPAWWNYLTSVLDDQSQLALAAL